MSWKVAPFTVATPRGRRDTIAGWVSEPFALDFRAFNTAVGFEDDNWFGGWVLTHIPTGYIVRRLACSLVEAQEFADYLRSADWDFSDPSHSKAMSQVVKGAMDAFPDIDCFGKADEIGPAFSAA